MVILFPSATIVMYNYRFYSPELGRWLIRDPIEEEGGWNLYAITSNDTINMLDINGLLECRSESVAAMDPWYGMWGWQSDSGKTSTCEGSFNHWGEARNTTSFGRVTSICNSGYMAGNTHITIDAKNTGKCPLRYKVTCFFAYSAKVGHDIPGKSGSKPGITFNAKVLGESFVTTVGLISGGKEVSLKVAGTVTKVICLTSSWQTLFTSYPSVTSGTRDMSGKWLGARLEEGLFAKCIFSRL